MKKQIKKLLATSMAVGMAVTCGATTSVWAQEETTEPTTETPVVETAPTTEDVANQPATNSLVEHNEYTINLQVGESFIQNNTGCDDYWKYDGDRSLFDWSSTSTAIPAIAAGTATFTHTYYTWEWALFIPYKQYHCDTYYVTITDPTPTDPEEPVEQPQNVYVYLKVEGAPENSVINGHNFITIGMTQLNGLPEITGVGQAVNVADYANAIASASISRYEPNASISLENVTWTDLKVDNGADDYVDAGTYVWHLDGEIQYEDLGYKVAKLGISYVDTDTEEVVAEPILVNFEGPVGSNHIFTNGNEYTVAAPEGYTICEGQNYASFEVPYGESYTAVIYVEKINEEQPDDSDEEQKPSDDDSQTTDTKDESKQESEESDGTDTGVAMSIAGVTGTMAVAAAGLIALLKKRH